MSYKKINETKVYKLAFELAMKIFEISKKFPKEEKYSLTDQEEGRLEAFVHVWRRHTEKDYMRLISFQKFQIQIWKMQKLKPGFSLRWLVYTSRKKSMMIF